MKSAVPRRAMRVPRRWWVALASLALVCGALSGAMLLRGGSRSEAQSFAASTWPPFTIAYTVRGINPVTGELEIDQGWRAVVRDPYTWRTEVVRDGVDAASVGSYSELRDGTLVTYNAKYKSEQRSDIGRGVVTPITVAELSPVTLTELLRGGGPLTDGGWVRAASGTPGRMAFEQRTSLPCVPAPTPPPAALASPPPPPGVVRSQALPRGPLACMSGPTTVPVVRRIEFDERNTRPTYDRGIAVYGERRIGGVIVDTFTVDSLDIQWPARPATPDVPGVTAPASSPP